MPLLKALTFLKLCFPPSLTTTSLVPAGPAMLSQCTRQLSNQAWAPTAAPTPARPLLPAPQSWAHTASRHSLNHSYTSAASRQPVLCASSTSQTTRPPNVMSAEQEADAVPSFEDLEARIGKLSNRATVSPLQPLVMVISGPSGVGKDAVIKELKDECPDLHFVVTATSRQRRQGEVDGVDYLFVSKAQFEEWVEEDALLEHALVYGDYKGIPRDQVQTALRRGTDVVLRVDVQGAATVRRLIPDSVSIFLVAENERELVQRLTARKTELMESMLVRVSTARQETAEMKHFDYVVVNKENQLSATVGEIRSIMHAEKLRVRRRLVA